MLSFKMTENDCFMIENNCYVDRTASSYAITNENVNYVTIYCMIYTNIGIVHTDGSYNEQIVSFTCNIINSG